MNKFALPIVVVVALGLIGLGVVVTDDKAPTTAETSQTDQSIEDPGVVISLDGKTVLYNGVAGEDALTTLRASASVETEESEFGEFVSAIEGVAADSSSEYWAFYVNGELASVGADSYIAQEGDTVEWKLESF